MGRLDDPKFRARALAVLAVLAGVAVLAVLVAVYVTSQQGQDNSQTIHRTDRKATVAKARADKAQTRADTAQTRADRSARKATRADKRALVLTRIVVQKGIAVQGAHGLRGGDGPIGKTGRPGRDAVFPFTLEAVAGQLAGRVPSAGDVLTTCGAACVGRDGTNGTDGKDATDTQVAAAVAISLPGALTANCGGPCNGANGIDGPPPTDAQIAAAVSVYCDAHNQCASTIPGPQGAAGTPGVTTTVLVVCTAPGVPDPACP